LARQKQAHREEGHTAPIVVHATAHERGELEEEATRRGVSLSSFAHHLMFRRSAARPNIGPHSEAAIIKRELEAAQHATNAAGNLLNQLARHANTTGELGPERLAELDDAIALTKRATELHIAAILHAMTL
jgi:hypothetical protein